MADDHPLVPLNDLSRGIARDSVGFLEAAARVLDSGRVIQGPEHSRFESEFAAYLGVREVMGVASGTDALELAMKATMTNDRDAVLTAANAGGYTTTAARRAGFRVRYADINPVTLCVDAKTVAEAITPDVGAVVITHLYGNLTEMSELVALCRERGIRLIEDCAQAVGARREDGMAGSFGDVSAISFYPTKNLGALGDGGAVATNDPQVAENVRRLRQYGWTSKYHVGMAGGVNSRLDELQAAFLRIRLPQLNALNLRRRQIVDRYVESSRSLSQGILRVLPADGEHHVAHLAVARSNEREYVRSELARLGVSTDVHFPIPDYAQPGFEPLDDGSFPQTSAACDEVLSLPCFPEMTDEEVGLVCAAIAALR